MQLRDTELAIKQSVAEGAALKGALDPLRGLAAQLAGEYSRIQDAAREAEARSVAAVETVQDIEKRLGPLAALQDLGRHTDERFEALNALAEEVTVKGHTLNGQKEMIAHAVAEAGRVADLVCAMEARIAKLKDGDHLLEQTEARLGRLEEVAAETTAQLERKEQLREELGRLETEVQTLTESGRRQVEASKTESVVWDDLRVQLRETELAIKQSVAEGAALKGALDPLRGLAAELAGEYSRIQDAAREAEARSVAAVETVQDIEKRLGPLAALQDLGRQTDERFEALNALAEEVTVKGQTLNGQKEMIAHAVAEAGRVADLVCAMEARIAKLKDGDHLLEQAEARLGRLEEIAAETTAQLERKERLSRRQAEASKTESVVWEDLRVQLRDTELAIKQSVAEGAALKGALDPLRGLATQLAEEYSRIPGRGARGRGP